jgi:L-rhamnose-H+ transport protein
MTGIAMGVLGIALCGIAGRYKEQDLSKKQSTALFNLSKGLPLCLLAGLLSAVYGFALDQGQPLADVAAKYGAGNFQGNVIYIFSNSGAFLSTLIYCLYLHSKQKTFAEYRKLQTTEKSTQLSFNFMMAAITGILWYGQFFFYGLGHVRMGDFKFTGWAIHMIMLVLFSSLAGIIMKEWIAVKGRTRIALLSALAILIIAVLVLTYGNYIGNITG